MANKILESIKRIANMSAFEFVIATIIAIVLGSCIGSGYSAWTGRNDTVIEKVAEEIVEYESENLLHLNRGALKGKIDLDVNPESTTTYKEQ